MLIAASICSAGTTEPDQQRQLARSASLKVGQKAPTFKLEFLNEKKDFDLKESFSKRPVVLIFGSYT